MGNTFQDCGNEVCFCVIDAPVLGSDFQARGKRGCPRACQALVVGNDFQVCGLSGCTACGQPGSRWCCPDSQPCSGTENYAGFWKGGAGSGTISFALPVGYNKGRLHLGISYSNPNCHGLVTVGGETIFDEVVLVEEHFVEFDCEFN